MTLDRTNYMDANIISVMKCTNEERNIFMEWIKGETQEALSDKYEKSIFRIDNILNKMSRRYNAVRIHQMENQETAFTNKKEEN